MQIVIVQSRTFETSESELQIQRGKPESISSSGSLPPPELLGLLVLIFSLLVGLPLLKAMFDSKEAPATPEPTAKIPCKHCRFYSPNLQLQCAVHPFRVSTPDAIQCSDYDFKHQKFRHNSLSQK